VHVGDTVCFLLDVSHRCPSILLFSFMLDNRKLFILFLEEAYPEICSGRSVRYFIRQFSFMELLMNVN
jgi:hypothetical protein